MVMSLAAPQGHGNSPVLMLADPAPQIQMMGAKGLQLSAGGQVYRVTLRFIFVQLY